jgi:hypothetical protein
MNDQDYFDYFLEMGAMRPEDEKLKRKQAMVDYLRQASFDAPQAKQAGNVVVAPSWTQVLGQVGQAYAANRGQKEADEMYGDLNAKRRARLEALRAKRNPVAPVVPGQEEDDVIEGFTASSYYR